MLTDSGGVRTENVFLLSSSFLTFPPTFTLRGDSTGGPPTTTIWMKDYVVITNGDPYNISVDVRGTADIDYRGSRYSCVLTVTGNLPGVYQYAPMNRQTTYLNPGSYTIEGIVRRLIIMMMTIGSNYRPAYIHKVGVILIII